MGTVPLPGTLGPIPVASAASFKLMRPEIPVSGLRSFPKVHLTPPGPTLRSSINFSPLLLPLHLVLPPSPGSCFMTSLSIHADWKTPSLTPVFNIQLGSKSCPFYLTKSFSCLLQTHFHCLHSVSRHLLVIPSPTSPLLDLNTPLDCCPEDKIWTPSCCEATSPTSCPQAPTYPDTRVVTIHESHAGLHIHRALSVASLSGGW